MQIDIRCREGPATSALREWTERRVRFAVGQFGAAIRSVLVRLSDENGPRGGTDQRCTMEARIPRLDPVVVEVSDADAYAAVSRAAERLQRRVRTVLGRQRGFDRVSASNS